MSLMEGPVEAAASPAWDVERSVGFRHRVVETSGHVLHNLLFGPQVHQPKVDLEAWQQNKRNDPQPDISDRML